MSPGKVASQLGHAFKLITLHSLQHNPKKFEEYLGDSIGTNICLIAPSLDHLLQIHYQAQNLNLPSVLVQDSGHIHLPDFTGDPIITALGLGPITHHEKPKLLSKLNLYGGEPCRLSHLGELK